MKVASWNVNGIRARQAQFLEWVELEAPDIICLQELKAAPSQIPDAVCILPGYWCYWHGSGAYSGVSLNLRHRTFPEQPRFEHPSFDRENRIVTASVGDFTVASVYVPNGGKDYAAKLDFMTALEQWVAEAESEQRQLIVCGDMNVARTDLDVHPKERKANAIGQRPDERALFEKILSRGLVDVARALHPDDGELFTWWAPWRNLRQRNIGWRIDYILASSALAARAESCVSQREFGTSDHGPLIATFSK